MVKMLRIGAVIAAVMTVSFMALDTARASEDGERVDVAVFELTGDGVDVELLETLTSILRQEAQQHSRYSLANPAAIRRDEIALVIGCDPNETECLREMGDYVEGRVLIFGEVHRVNQGLHIAVDILDIDEGDEPIRVERTIDDSQDAVVAFRREVEEIFEGIDSLGETHLVVVAPSDDIAIRIDDVVAGRGSLERVGMKPGTYQVTVGDLWDEEVELTPGQVVEIRPEARVVAGENSESQRDDDDTKMAVEENDVDPGAPSPMAPMEYEGRRSNAGAYSLVTVGMTSLAASGIMIFLMRGIENQISEENAAGTMDERRHAELSRRGESYQTAQYVLLGVGAATLFAGAGWAMWNFSRDRSDAANFEAGISVHPAWRGIALSGRW